MERKAECCCGKTTIALEGDPAFQVVCHCIDCKKTTGSAFRLSAFFFERQVLRKAGTTTVYEGKNIKNRPYKSHFCPYCGTNLYWYFVQPGNFIAVAGGCFVENSLPDPGFSNVHEDKCSWLSLADHIKKELEPSDIPEVPA